MKAHPALARRAVKPRSRKAVREAQGSDGTDEPQGTIRIIVMLTCADAVRLIRSSGFYRSRPVMPACGA